MLFTCSYSRHTNVSRLFNCCSQWRGRACTSVIWICVYGAINFKITLNMLPLSFPTGNRKYSSLPYTHTRICTRSHTHIHTHMRTLSLTHTCTSLHTHTLAHARSVYTNKDTHAPLHPNECGPWGGSGGKRICAHIHPLCVNVRVWGVCVYMCVYVYAPISIITLFLPQ